MWHCLTKPGIVNPTDIRRPSNFAARPYHRLLPKIPTRYNAFLIFHSRSIVDLFILLWEPFAETDMLLFRLNMIAGGIVLNISPVS